MSIRMIFYNSIILTICVVSAHRLNLRGARTSQVGTWNNHHSGLAVDGNIHTFSVACKRCDANNPTDTTGWWKIDFNHDVVIAVVELITSHNHPDSDYLQEITVGVARYPGKYFRDYKVCGKYEKRGLPLPSNHRIVIVCATKLSGRSIIIWKKENALVRPDAISIAEVNFFTEREDRFQEQELFIGRNEDVVGGDVNYGGHSYSSPGSNVQFGFPNSGAKVMEPSYGHGHIPRVNLPSGMPIAEIREVTQSSTYDNHFAKLALDRNQNTYSIAGSNLKLQQPGWWQADLGKLVEVIGLTIISSSDYKNAQSLKNFKILVSQFSYTQDPNFQRSFVCCEINTEEKIPIKTLIAYNCVNPIRGRYITIMSTNGPMSLAEVVIYIQ